MPSRSLNSHIEGFLKRQPFVLEWTIRLGAAVVFVGMAAGIRAALNIPVLPYFVFLPFISAAAFYFGRVSGIIAVQIAAVLAAYFFLPAVFSFSQIHALSIFIFNTVSTGIALICARLAATLRQNELDKQTLESRIAAEVESRLHIEDTLRQSQKMEAVGQLTGGVAHDFGNLLMVISASIDLMESRIARGQYDGIDEYQTGAKAATARGSALTQRLLSFSRRQTVEPVDTDVSALFEGMRDMLLRTLGGGIDLIFTTPPCWICRVDQSQLENAVLNLCINARDAMPNGGESHIEVRNEALHNDTADLGLPEGEYVRLSVTDTGTGMPPEVAEHIFEPFFTTKPVGKGTGLGLSMISGFARQAGGAAYVASTGEHGTTMCLLLPRHKPS